MFQVPLSGVSNNNGIVSIQTNISSDNLSASNASIQNLTVQNLKAIVFNPIITNTSSLNTSSITIPNNFIFPKLNVTELNASKQNFSNLSAVNISCNFITASNIQEKLTAGTNINISNNVISATAELNLVSTVTLNTSFLNTSVLNASNISTGSLDFGTGLILENNQLRADSINTITEGSQKLVTSGAVFGAFQNNTNNNVNFITHINETSTPYAVTTIRTIVSPAFELPFIKTFYKSKLGPGSSITITAQFSYTVDGNGSDNLIAKLRRKLGSADVEICQQRQMWTNAGGGGTRSGTVSPIMGSFVNPYTLGQEFEIQVSIQNLSDDNFNFIAGAGETKRTSILIVESMPVSGLTTLTADFITSNNALNGSELICQPNNANGKAFIGKCTIGNTTFSNMMSLSLPGNDNGTNYAIGQVQNNETIVNCAVAGSGNSFRIRNVEGMRNTSVGLSISPGAGNRNPTQALDVVGNMLITGSITCNSINTTNESITNLSSQNISVNNITVTGNFEGTNFSTTNLIPGNNISINSSGVISSFFGSNSNVDIGTLHVDNNTEIFGTLNVSETSRFQESLQVENQLILGKSGTREGHIIFVGQDVGSNYTLRVRDTSIINNTTNLLDKYVFKINNVSTLIIKENEVNISGALLATSGNFSTINLSNLNISSINLSLDNLSVDNLSTEEADIVILTSDTIVANIGDFTSFKAVTINGTTGNFSTINSSSIGFDSVNTTNVSTTNASLSNVTSPRWSVRTIVHNLNNLFPTINSPSGETPVEIANNIVINSPVIKATFHCMGYHIGQNPGALSANYKLQIKNNATNAVTELMMAAFFFNQENVHQAWSNSNSFTNIIPGTYSFIVLRNSINLIADNNDRMTVILEEYPF